uniref:receptor protein-tyrosine kinase n=1 Tax=Scleropages formosus TaxID=113540 RepID=A0A8C9T4A1_SCLFO
FVFNARLHPRIKAGRGKTVWWSVSLGVHLCFVASHVSPSVSLGPRFVQSPANMTLSQGKPVKMQCMLQMDGSYELPPDVLWQKDIQALDFADTSQMQIPINEDTWMVISELSIHEVQLSDMGSYRCVANFKGQETVSLVGYIQLEGLPHFSEEPRDILVVANVSLSLRCVAHGPPEPVRVIWLQDGVPLNILQDPVSLFQRSAHVPWLNKTSTFSCEAHNRKGVATSGSGTVTVIPSQPQEVRAIQVSSSSLHIAWRASFGGVYPITEQINNSFFIELFLIQVTACSEDLTELPATVIRHQSMNSAPSDHVISDLKPLTEYNVRVACSSTQGESPWTPWVTLHTSEGVPDSPPANVTAILNGTNVIVSWEEPPGELNGHLLGYTVEYIAPNMEQVRDILLHTCIQTQAQRLFDMLLFSTVLYSTVQYTVTYNDPVSRRPHGLISHSTHFLSGLSSSSNLSWQWWYVAMAIVITVALATLAAVYVTRRRRKETRFGEAFEPMMQRGELVVRYQARRTYSRRTNEATLNRLGISDELKQKLQDVMVDRHKLTLGKTLGEGEFGSVMEGLLTQEETVLRVAVKTMKIAICTRTEMEDFLREAACMKDFDHPNIMRLLGVCLQTVEGEGYPSPVVILPYMKHGDLHSYLLYSRLGDCPVFLPTQMLVKFMTDIARGMEYLSSKNFIHRDLAARNCMLNENMTVCVADFGLSKKIYNGDYYRQGRISKMPVKWIAIESLADRVYTSKSDVWSFGVTMWEIATRGQTPYPGVENSEIYDYLRQGNRLKQPPDCLDSIYALMFSCWLLSPKDRPGFEFLRCELEKTLEELPDLQDPDEILYVNMEEARPELGAVGGRDPLGVAPPFSLKGPDPVTASADVHQPGRYVLWCTGHAEPLQHPRGSPSPGSSHIQWLKHSIILFCFVFKQYFALI